MILYLVNLLAKRILTPFLPIARLKFSSLTIARAILSFSSSMILTITSLAGLNAFLTNSASSSLHSTKSTFSPLSSDKILAILEPRSPIQVPIASILSLVDDTATLLRTPASLATA